MSSDRGWYDLRLYVAGHTPRSAVARVNLRRVCERHLAGRHRVEVIDLLEHPARAATDGILAIPTLVRREPEPVRKIVGDLSEVDRLVAGLQLSEVGDDTV